MKQHWKGIGFCLLLIVLLLSGCSSPKSTHGIPNLAQVVSGVYRGGQPTEDGWRWLLAQGVTNVIKLNTEQEGSDAPAAALGMHVRGFPITGTETIFETDLRKLSILLIRASNTIKPNTFIHCEHGQDRTGAAVAVWRITNGWTKAQAEQEMLALGFHKSCRALWETWEDKINDNRSH